MSEEIEPKRKVGIVTGTTTVGATAGAAIAQVIVYVWPGLAEIEPAITVLLTLALGVLAGYLVPPQVPEAVTVYEGDEGDLVEVSSEISTPAGF